jgi:hypothetical protein
VAAGDEADEDALEHLVLARDDALHLDERLLEERARLLRVALGDRRDGGLAFRCGHVCSSCRRRTRAAAGGAPVAGW